MLIRIFVYCCEQEDKRWSQVSGCADQEGQNIRVVEYYKCQGHSFNFCSPVRIINNQTYACEAKRLKIWNKIMFHNYYKCYKRYFSFWNSTCNQKCPITSTFSSFINLNISAIPFSSLNRNDLLFKKNKYSSTGQQWIIL